MNDNMWPIRVGGRYASKIHTGKVYFRVTAITGETVHFVHSHADGREFAAMDFSVRLFCESAHPEDQSPIPELLEVLQEVDEYLAKRADAHHDGERYVPDSAMRLLTTVRAAIARAEAA